MNSSILLLVWFSTINVSDDSLASVLGLWEGLDTLGLGDARDLQVSFHQVARILQDFGLERSDTLLPQSEGQHQLVDFEMHCAPEISP